MKKKISSVYALGFLSLFFVFMMSFVGCSGSGKSTDSAQELQKDDEAFYQTQPLHSGLYDADSYDITGPNARKGRFDGRIFFSLSPETSAFYVFENGNRTKIDYLVSLAHPFEKGDSGIYTTMDSKERPVTIYSDSTGYFLTFQRSGEDLKIGFNPKPRYEGSAVEILEKMSAQKKK